MRPLPGRSVVGEYYSRFDADLARAVLTEAGLEAAILGDPAHAVAPHLVTERVFQLVVRDEIAEHAIDVLADQAPEDPEADALDARFHQRRFRDRPTWMRWMSIALMTSLVGPIALAALLQLGWLTRGLFP